MTGEQQRELASLQKQYDVLSEKIDVLRQATAIETDVTHKLKQEKQLEEAEGERMAVEERIAKLRKEGAAVRFYANAPYGLEAGFTGRSRELAMLDEWFSEDKERPLLALIALGGTGKSALAWYWQQQLQEQANAPQNVIWWSFYETGSGPAEFLFEVLSFFGDRPQEYGGPRL